jgi:hypothetical protein
MMKFVNLTAKKFFAIFEKTLAFRKCLVYNVKSAVLHIKNETADIIIFKVVFLQCSFPL